MPDYDLMDLRKWTQNIEKLRGIEGDGLEDELLSDALISGEKSRGVETLPSWMEALYLICESSLHARKALIWCTRAGRLKDDSYNGAMV